MNDLEGSIDSRGELIANQIVGAILCLAIWAALLIGPARLVWRGIS